MESTSANGSYVSVENPPHAPMPAPFWMLVVALVGVAIAKRFERK